MPLLDSTDKGIGQHVCIDCGREREIKKTEWIVSDEDDTTFTSPPCSCGAQETFLVHDWVYESTRTKTVSVKDGDKVRKVFDPTTGEKVVVTQTETETFTDPSHFGAEQSVLIDRMTASLKRKKAKRSNGKFKYDKEPKAPDPDKVREAVTKRGP